MKTGKAVFLFLAITKNFGFNYYPFFYQPRTFFGEPRFEHEWLSSIDITIRGGHATNAYNNTGDTVNPLGIYGCENIYALAKNVPQSILDCNPDCLFNTVWQYTSYSPFFAHLAITGKFSSLECLPVVTQNFSHGFFTTLSIPIKKLCIKNLTFQDLTTKKNMITEIKYPIWQTTINHLNEHMQCYGLYTGATKNVGLGDIQLLGGLTLNYEKTTTLDFLDFTIATGINFPTSKKQNINSPWCLPLGYNGHTAIPFISEVALGFFDWCTIGIQTGALWFNTIWRTMPFKTTYEQSGWIRLTRARACIEKGTIWHIDEYLKLDHIIGGFSAIFGFTHDHANRTVITPDNSQDFDSAIINSDECLHPWTLTAFNFMLEFDFATFNHPNIPRIAITIDKSISGKHAFDAALFGTHLAIDFEW